MPASPSSSPTLRRRVEVFSRPALIRLQHLPRMVVPLLTVVLLALGALAPLSVAYVALAVVLAFMAWIAYLSWPAVTTSGRLMRIAMVVLILALGATRL
jgi:hypothetical protein